MRVQGAGRITERIRHAAQHRLEVERQRRRRRRTGADGSGWINATTYRTPQGELLTDPVSQAAYLRTVQDWVVRPQMRAVEG